MNFNFFSRTTFLSLGILGIALVLISKLFWIQIVNSETYASRADRQYATPAENIFERGSILFSRKDGELISAAAQTTGYKLAIDTTKIKDPEDVYLKLSQKIELSREDFMAKANKKNDVYEEVAKRLSRSQADSITSMKISGVSLHQEKWRIYPGEELASHTLGLVGWSGDELGGRYGLERQYDGNLRRDGKGVYMNFFAEVFLNVRDTLFDGGNEEANVITTIEPSVADFFEKKLSEVKKKYSAELVGGIIMNPANGEIYAMSAKPDFNPNDFSKVEDVSVFSNPLVENVYEFGSVVKPLVMAAGIDVGVVSASTKYEDKGSVVVENKVINNFDKKARGVVDMQEVLTQSLNTGMVFVYNKLGKDRLREYLFSFGFKDKTGIDLPNEASSLVSNLNVPRNLEYANASFGQGIALTPMAMTRGLAVLANGGNLVTPHVVRAVKYENGIEKKVSYPTIPTKLKPATIEEVTRMLVNTLDKTTVPGVTKMDRYSIAIKTGTAQVAKKAGGGYYEDKNTHSFFGYFPAHEPEFIVFLFAVDPRGTEYASVTWTVPFLDIAKFLLNYYEVPPDR